MKLSAKLFIASWFLFPAFAFFFHVPHVLADWSSDVITGGTGTCTNELGGSPCTNAHDNNEATAWVSNNTMPAFWKYDLGVGITKQIEKVSVYYDAGNTNSANFTFEGSNDNSSWTTLQTVTGEANTLGWHTWEFTNATAYRYYKINSTENYRGDNYVGLAEVDAFEYVAPSEATTTATTTDMTFQDNMIIVDVLISLAFVITMVLVFKN